MGQVDLNHISSDGEITLEKINKLKKWKILVVDDEKDVHSLTNLLLRNLEFHKKGIKTFDAFSSEEAKEIIKANPDIQLVLLDVVMETPDAGLEFVKYVREELNNNFTRIIIRTGQPGMAPQNNVFSSYDIDNYTCKTELTADNFSMLILTELKNYYKYVESFSTDPDLDLHNKIAKEKELLEEEINEHLQIEELLKESEKRFKALLDTAVGWEYWITESGKIKYSSPSCYKITGYKAEEFISGKIKFEDIVHPDDLSFFEIHSKDELLTHRDFTTEFRIINKNKCEKVLLHTCQAVFDCNGKFVGRRVSNHDITRQKIKETIIKNSEEKFRQLNQTKNQLFSVIAHDLKSPFLSILGFTEILSEEIKKIKDEDLLSITGSINQSVKKVYELIENLLTWSRLQNEQINFNPLKFNLKSMTDKIVDLYSLQAKTKNINLKNELDEKTEVFADHFMVDTIIRNLVNNSIKFTKNGYVKIFSEDEPEFVKITVEDNGVGISKENIQKLFKSFNLHCQTTIQNESGSGIGLLLCKEFVEKNKGEISIYSEENKITKFSFTLPKTKIKHYGLPDD